ncbi:3-isopropylmalate dehydratase small subunit [Desulfatitalea alkaliphila]|uniref:3-isopropylmalate dehydratase n=1 Tax=Desulfatitalea alkaliphila TaxID=2929485 RepID=A0AA41R2V9_9BACT|nr:3-isopropylmalate dehydratase small subunit [Desulfatitalea alkaliphila]MCJ8501889.1 3-isopropylmalate dehydratase small subunit [Desulfatitalea alkaliphila]
MKDFNGEVLFLDRSDINTDEIIPARYLTEISKEALAPHLLEDLSLEEFDAATDIAGKRAVVSRANFGCGSSREHAPWALEVNGITVVIAAGFARIFRQNMFNCGMLAIELPEAEIDRLFSRFAGKPTHLETDFDAGRLTFHSEGDSETIPFTVSDFDRALVQAGGWVEYADARY